ncbi:MAG: QacE family quaternary ammonium compound efflux SMR transporter [Azoarcus sp.]|jgi:small multidrug resistance pump|nr:QacE family quaternary ammonium compound efflux SMR transporter [Azoarcus sp.]
MHFLHLTLAIVAEVIATTALKACEGFTRPLPSLVVIVGYIIALYFLALAQKALPVGLIYAIWSGVGIVLVSIAAWLIYGQVLDKPAILGLVLIVAGVVVINVFSKSIPH